jgi:hypothetical protein
LLDAYDQRFASKGFHYSYQAGLVAVNHTLRLDLRFMFATLNRQVKVVGFYGFWLLRIILIDDVPNFCDSWLSVSVMLDTEDQQFA